jgi:hypothetical protein
METEGLLPCPQNVKYVTLHSCQRTALKLGGRSSDFTPSTQKNNVCISSCSCKIGNIFSTVKKYFKDGRVTTLNVIILCK